MYLKKELTAEAWAEMTRALEHRAVKLSSLPVCDFCGEQPIVVYANQDMSTGAQVPCWRWCACKACSEALDAGDVATVKARAKARLAKMVPTASDRFLTASVEQAWHIFKPIEVKNG